jgi:hypothetical protein
MCPKRVLWLRASITFSGLQKIHTTFLSLLVALVVVKLVSLPLVEVYWGQQPMVAAVFDFPLRFVVYVSIVSSNSS